MAEFYREVSVNAQYWSYGRWRDISINKLVGSVVIQAIYPSKVKRLSYFHTLESAETWLATQVSLNPKRYRFSKNGSIV